MPSASANISAKFIAQIETSNDLRDQEERAGRRRPGRGSSAAAAGRRRPASRRRARGSPASPASRSARSFIIASRLAVVEVGPHARRAGQVDADTGRPSAVRSGALEVVGGADHLASGPAAAPAITIAVWPSARDRLARLRRGRPTRRARRRAAAPRVRATVAAKAGSATRQGRRVDDDHQARATRCRRSSRWIEVAGLRPTPSRESSQPAPESAVSTRGARTPRPTTTTAQATKTTRAWVADQRPSRPIGPSALIGRTRAGAVKRRSTSEAGQSPASDERPLADGRRRR